MGAIELRTLLVVTAIAMTTVLPEREAPLNDTSLRILHPTIESFHSL